MFSLICVWINVWINDGEAGDLKHYRAHYDVTVMIGLDRRGVQREGILPVYLYNGNPYTLKERLYIKTNPGPIQNKNTILPV